MDSTTFEPPRILFVTGRLAEFALRRVLDDLAPRVGFVPEIAVMPISVAALMPPKWVARHLDVPPGIHRVILPGHCRGDLSPVIEKAGAAEVELGPEDLRDLPRHFGRADPRLEGYGAFDIEILAEINHAPQLSMAELLDQAARFRAEGADRIDLGCDPGGPWRGVREAVAALVEAGHRVSIDSFDPMEVALAVEAGADLVLSVNATNREHAPDWGVEVVAIPDQPGTLDGLDATIDFLDAKRVPFRIDPILEPIGFGFAASLGRYLDVRRRFPDADLMMGIGNLTELTDVDSAGVNTLLIGFCQELRVGSVLTTAVINWARTSVREIDLARRLAYHAVNQRTLPKHLEPDLVMLRDPKVERFGRDGLDELAKRIKDPNWRIFAEDGRLYAINGAHFLSDNDPFALFDQMGIDDVSHAFYLGYELMKAKTALTLSKNYQQDQALRWGMLTEPEISAQDRRKGIGGDVVILEGIVTTLDPAGVLNVAPMGPRVEPDMRRFVLRPYKTSTTYRNLKAHGEGVFHVTDDVLMLAQGAIGRVEEAPTRPAEVVRGRILTDACRCYEFRVTEIDDREDRTTIHVETVAQGRFRDFFGLNRAKHAVVEAAILATRTEFLSLTSILAEYRKLAVLVEKTGGAPGASGLFPVDRARARGRASPRPGPGCLAVMSVVQIDTASRLHFGLLGWGPDAYRQFGGVGLMVDRPGLRIEARPAACWEASGPLAERALKVARSVAESLSGQGVTVPRVSFHVQRGAPEHVGLGTGTQLSLAVARLLGEFAGCGALPVEQLASLTCRGKRSGVGLHGFAHGGLIVDGGRRGDGENVPPLLVQSVFPTDWRVLIVLPLTTAGLHGQGEIEAFRRLPPVPEAVNDRLCRLVLLGLLPALAEHDLEGFGKALTELQQHVGRLFAPAQGGSLFQGPQSEAIVSHLRTEGLHGVGQSSWGPALYGFCAEDTDRQTAVLDRLRDRFSLGPAAAFWTEARPRGATVTIL